MSKETEENYSLVIYQSTKNRKRFYLQLRKNGKRTGDRLYNHFNEIANTARSLIQYSGKNAIGFKEAWDSDEMWSTDWFEEKISELREIKTWLWDGYDVYWSDRTSKEVLGKKLEGLGELIKWLENLTDFGVIS